MPEFSFFERKKVLKNIFYVCMAQYDETFGLPIAFPPQSMKESLLMFLKLMELNSLGQPKLKNMLTLPFSLMAV